MEPERDWWSPKEAAHEIGVSEATVLRWIEGERLEATQPGGPGTHIRISREEVQRAKGRRKGTAACASFSNSEP